MAGSAKKLILVMALLLLPLSAIAFTKVVVLAGQKGGNSAKSKWATDPVIAQRHNFTLVSYQKSNSNASNYYSYHHGGETGVHLKYIVDHYDDFPDVAIFAHPKQHEHQTNWLSMLECISPNANWFNLNQDVHGQAAWAKRHDELL